MMIYGHRGDSVSAPENTLRAFELAIEAGVDGIELDVRASADGVPVVIHDRGLERTTTGRGNVDSLTLAEIQEADAGQGQRVPTLDEALDVIRDRVRLDLEIKQSGMEHLVVETLNRHPTVDWLISCFDWNVLRELRRLDPAAELWPLHTDASPAVIDAAREIGAPAVALSHAAITKGSARAIRDAGLEIFAWTVNDPDEARRLELFGVHAFCTDNPRLMLAARA